MVVPADRRPEPPRLANTSANPGAGCPAAGADLVRTPIDAFVLAAAKRIAAAARGRPADAHPADRFDLTGSPVAAEIDEFLKDSADA